MLHPIAITETVSIARLGHDYNQEACGASYYFYTDNALLCEVIIREGTIYLNIPAERWEAERWDECPDLSTVLFYIDLFEQALVQRFRSTTDLMKLRQYPELFTWGQFISFLEIGEYTIIQYHPWKSREHTILTGEPDTDQISYHGYVYGKNVSRSWSTLDAALAGLICYKHQGPNAQAGDYFMKMLGA